MGAIWKLAELVLLDIDRAQRKKKHGFYQERVSSTPIHLDLDPMDVSLPVANAIKELVQEGIRTIAVPSWDGKRKFSVDTGRLWRDLFVMPIRNVGYVIRVPRDRFVKARWTVEAFDDYKRKLFRLVPALNRPELIFRTTRLKTAIEHSLDILIKVEKKLTQQAKTTAATKAGKGHVGRAGKKAKSIAGGFAGAWG